MRIEPYAADSFVHVLKRGARGMAIIKKMSDKWRFVRLLYYMNDIFPVENWERITKNLGVFVRSSSWPERKPLVKVLAYCLMPNHFHLILKEAIEGGISKFMQKLCNSMSTHFNLKYNEKGSIFQGAFKSKTVSTDDYMRYLVVYVMVKNPMELYPHGGLAGAMQNFDDAWEWAVQYPFCSLKDYVENRDSPIVDKDIFGEIWKDKEEFKEFARDCILSRNLEDMDNLEN